MPTLENYNHFDGLHWETGCIYNFFDYRGLKAPHTARPYSEALLLGVSGGIVMGYFSFAYEGHDPQARILTRNTFDPVTTMLSRLGVVQNVYQTTNPQKAEQNLLRELESGIPPLVVADVWSLPYSFPMDDIWWMRPVLVYGYDVAAQTVSLADGAHVPLHVSTDELAKARARVKKDKFRIITLEAPDPSRLATAVQQGIWDCIKLFTEKPPKGGKNSFGFAAYKWLAEQLTHPKARMSWEKEFPAGASMYSGLTWLYTDLMLFTRDDCADRGLYADFLDEASLILNKPTLRDVAQRFRDSARAWSELSVALLPDDVPAFRETRELMRQRRELFREQGDASRAAAETINQRLKEIRQQVAADFPLNAAQVVAFRQNLSRHILTIHDLEKDAIDLLQSAMK